MKHHTSLEAFERLRKDYAFFCDFFKLKGDLHMRMWTTLQKEDLYKMLMDYNRPLRTDGLHQLVFRDMLCRSELLEEDFEDQLKALRSNLIVVRQGNPIRQEMIVSLFERMVKFKDKGVERNKVFNLKVG